ncbi:MAG: VWA domain-containing protein [Clostridia bacterium]|nr:VWA domain-containing protein [Clostridia bacterium]
MSFVYPAGLWALLGLVLLMVFSLMKRRSEVTTISSTYLWRLADQHRRKNRYLRRVKRILFFLLQFAALLFAALLIAQPVVMMPGSGVNVAVILDASGSMNMKDAKGETRFARAVAAVERDMEKLPWGASVTVLLAGDEAVMACDHVSAGTQLRAALEGVTCGWGAGDLDGALSLCEEMMAGGTISRAVLYTDTQYEQTEGIEVVCLRGEDEWNLSLAGLRAEGSIYGTVFETTAISSGKGAEVSFELMVDGKLQDEAMIELRVNGETQPSSSAYCPEDEETAVSLLLRQVYDYSDVRVVAHAQDGLAADNEARLYQRKAKTARVLLVGEDPYFWEKMLEALPQTELDVAKSLKDAQLEGYDIYAFDGCLPESLPKDGAVWLLNPPRSPREIGVVFGERLVGSYVTKPNAGGALEEKLTEDLMLRDVAVARFYEMTSQGSLENVLMCGRMPVMAAGKNENGCLLIVMPFDLQDSNLPLLTDCMVLAHNMTEASAPTLLSAQHVACGERIYPQPHPLSDKLFLQTPDMHLNALDMQVMHAGVMIETPGSYTLLQEVRGKQQVLSFYAQVPEQERMITNAPEQEPLVLSVNEGEKQEAQERVFYPARAMAVLVLLLLLAEWGMYHRERY